MSRKEDIVNLLNLNNAMTQSALAEGIYVDKQHGPNVYSALMALVEQGVVIRTGSNPSYYSLTGKAFKAPEKVSTANKKAPRDVSGDVVSNEAIEEVEALVQGTNNYGPETDLITRCLKKFPLNTDPDVVAMKVGLIDITNSTHLSQHKSKISMVELAEIIAAIPDVDERIKNGDPEVVNIIARSNGEINLFSFALKYCCYHNSNLYGRDDFSILDTILKEYLPRYFDGITRGQIQRWQDSFNYKDYNDYITGKLDELGITVENRKRKFDHYVWYLNR
ncbi:hypothetical protein [uncultured Tyzzerella sp.]|uniref:hypothetical protein n=1 Tax=uncultured Tyzzerella sp. TaxID=2321398 RepID=UPI0029439622|nr:hypothetical protein [uncultured Tyzzerella sp.]